MRFRLTEVITSFQRKGNVGSGIPCIIDPGIHIKPFRLVVIKHVELRITQ